jgi:hypothetical protein
MKGIIFDFIEENWVAFRRTCKDHGIPDDEVEGQFDKFKRDLNDLDGLVEGQIQKIGRGLRYPNTVTYE